MDISRPIITPQHHHKTIFDARQSASPQSSSGDLFSIVLSSVPRIRASWSKKEKPSPRNQTRGFPLGILSVYPVAGDRLGWSYPEANKSSKQNSPAKLGDDSS